MEINGAAITIHNNVRNYLNTNWTI